MYLRLETTGVKDINNVFQDECNFEEVVEVDYSDFSHDQFVC